MDHQSESGMRELPHLACCNLFLENTTSQKGLMALKLNKAAFHKIKQESKKKKEHTLLLVDDEDANLRSIERALNDEYNILTASDGQEALELIQNLKDPTLIHLILSDQRMPRLTGVEFLAKTLKIIPKTIRMILTGFTDVDAIITSINEGHIYKFLVKPIEPADLRITVKRALESYELEKENANLMEELKTVNASLEEKVQNRTAELEQAYQTIKAQQAKIHEDLEEAKETQQSLLPLQLPTIPQVQLACRHVSMVQIGGDFYNIFPVQDDCYGFLIADVTGHGASAALISFLISGIFSEAQRAGESTELVMNLTNGMLVGKLPEYKFASMFYAIYNASSQKLTYTNCGHPPALLIRPTTQEIISLETDGMLVGLFPNDITLYEEKQIALLPGDKVVFYTDAILETQGDRDNMLGVDQWKTFLLDHAHLPIQALLDQAYDFGLAYSGQSQYEDDFTCIGFEIMR